MDKLSFLDAAFLRMESTERPFHVAGLMVFKLPEDAPQQFLRRLAGRCGRLNELWPVFDKKLREPDSMSNPAWQRADDYNPDYHIFHYALPAPGRMEDLLALVTRAHERLLDRRRPLWEIHLIEGLQGGRFAMYCKVHHALVDGVGALRMVDALFSTSPEERIDFRAAKPRAEKQHRRLSLARQIDTISSELKKHYRAIPQVSGLIAGMSRDAWLGKKDVPPLPFTAPRTLFNTDIDGRRQFVIAELPLSRVRALGEACDGTINDALVALCGGALREYLLKHDALPKKSMEAGVPVSIKRTGDEEGNQVGFIICPFHTELRDPLQRLRRIVKVTRKAKQNFRDMSTTAAQDYTNVLLLPTLALSASGNASRVTPALNAIVSNVPGPKKRLYLDGAPLERLYPLSVVFDGMGINITVISYMGKLCFAITSCPTEQPEIEELGSFIKQSYKDLTAAVAAKKR
jgi:WS/DGAT/MGAT family acyltransferase